MIYWTEDVVYFLSHWWPDLWGAVTFSCTPCFYRDRKYVFNILSSEIRQIGKNIHFTFEDSYKNNREWKRFVIECSAWNWCVADKMFFMRLHNRLMQQDDATSTFRFAFSSQNVFSLLCLFFAVSFDDCAENESVEFEVSNPDFLLDEDLNLVPRKDVIDSGDVMFIHGVNEHVDDMAQVTITGAPPRSPQTLRVSASFCWLCFLIRGFVKRHEAFNLVVVQCDLKRCSCACLHTHNSLLKLVFVSHSVSSLLSYWQSPVHSRNYPPKMKMITCPELSWCLCGWAYISWRGN